MHTLKRVQQLAAMCTRYCSAPVAGRGWVGEMLSCGACSASCGTGLSFAGSKISSVDPSLRAALALVRGDFMNTGPAFWLILTVGGAVLIGVLLAYGLISRRRR
jgi:hypothetical protein